LTIVLNNSKPQLFPSLYSGVLLTIGVGMTVATGFVHGHLTQRWGPVPDLEAAASELEALPRTIGKWQTRSEEELPKLVQQTLSCAGYVNREYVNQQTGQVITVAIIVGPSGPTAVHTPEICYSSRAYSIQAPRQKSIVTDQIGRAHSFWNLSFSSTDLTMDRLRVYYGWTTDFTGIWTASESPRFEFAGERMLYKLQLAAQIPATAVDDTQDPCRDFLTALLQLTPPADREE
jgi:hypothetical protein